jgi:hypothetical protein
MFLVWVFFLLNIFYKLILFLQFSFLNGIYIIFLKKTFYILKQKNDSNIIVKILRFGITVFFRKEK